MFHLKYEPIEKIFKISIKFKISIDLIEKQFDRCLIESAIYVVYQTIIMSRFN